MPLTAGDRIGPYNIVSPLGAGGMGEVYRVRDTRLGRDVAIKVLPEAFANDAERLSRFQHEAQLLASLNHPHIAIIHGLEESNGSHALVMELVEGPTLADRIAQGPIPVDEALPIARQIAEALEAAHERGVIHRDLKPANIKVTPAGQVKVLDFGLAKLAEADGANVAGLSMSPTISVQATVAGVILGTAAYMSPEQARGKPVDRRTDIWAYGCVLFEMLTGKQAFETGETVSDAVAAILKNDPDWNALPPDTPAHTRMLLRRCLQKDPQKRLPHIGVVRLEIDEAAGADSNRVSADSQALQGRTMVRRERTAWGVAAVAVAATLMLAVPAVRHIREALPLAPPEMRTEIVTPATIDSSSIALSPDGRQIVFVASGDGPSRLWLRSIASSEAQPLSGTEGAANPFWSPDSRSLGFFADGALKRLDINRGSPQVLAKLAGSGRGGTWNAEGVILFPTGTTSSLYRVPASGGEVEAVTKLDRQISHRYPIFLPDGRRFLFYAIGAPETQGIYLGALDSAQVKRLTAAETSSVYMPDGWVLWVRGSTLVAERLDLDREELVGNQIAIADPAGFDSNTSLSAVSVSASGLVAYRVLSVVRRQLIWFDRAGKMLGQLTPPDETSLLSPRLSPDDRRVAVFRTVQGNSDVWVLDGTRLSRFTFDATLDRYPTWSADGSRIVFDSTREGVRELYEKPASGAGSEQLLLESSENSENNVASSSSGNGRFLSYSSQRLRTGWDTWILPMERQRKPWPFLATSFNERSSHFSPDGHWLAYASDAGRYEVYVRPFTDPEAAGAGESRNGGQWQVSTSGGPFPRWSADGKELFYVAPDGRMMGAPISATAETLAPGTPEPLFVSRMYGGGTSPDVGRQYDVTSDGRFLINTVVDETAAPITILQNWKPPVD